MAASTNLDNAGVQPLRVADFSQGIITAIPPNEIPDNALQDALNFEIDDSGNLSTRRGVTQLSADTFDDRITSLHYFSVESGEVGILFTTGTTVRIIETGGTGLTNLTGALTLPDDTFWQWRTFAGIAIGVNKATSGDNPIKVTAVPVASALGGSPPKAKYLEVWNNRLWLVSATEPNQVWGSALGLPENWTVDDAAGAVTLDIDADDGDLITGLYATREALYVFKRKRIYRIVAFAEPNTDVANLRVDIVTTRIGCVSPYSIQQVVDDVLFLSDQGVASLALVQTAEDFKTAFYSRNVAELERFPKATEEIPSFLFDSAAQYWLSLPESVSPTGSAQVYVLDYLKIAEGLARWTRFNGLVAGTAYTSFQTPTGKMYIIGAENPDGDFQLYEYMPREITATFNDNGAAYTKRFKTKSFNGGVQLIRKFWHEWAISLDLLSATAQAQIAYYFDQNPLRGDSYGFTLEGEETGALWGPGLWADGLWGSQFSGAFDIVRELKSNSFGRESQDITFTVENSGLNQGLTVQDFQLWLSAQNQRRVTDV